MEKDKYNPRSLDRYFPITKILTESQLSDLDLLAEYISSHPNFNLLLFDEGQINQTKQLPTSITRFITGHISEIFYYRQDILDQLLTKPVNIRLYTTPQAYKDDGGVNGGMFSSATKSLHLTLSRLFEGYGQDIPGVAPFLHEFGHLLDYSRSNRQTKGLLPGHSKEDGAIFTPIARKLFLKGKRLELDRYLACCLNGPPSDPDQLPIGSTYVFKRDTEFIAGYFEMFFRNPNYFAKQNIDLYHSFVYLLQQDPRQFVPQDFPNYINKNQNFYLTQTPPPPGITIVEY